MNRVEYHVKNFIKAFHLLCLSTPRFSVRAPLVNLQNANHSIHFIYSKCIQNSEFDIIYYENIHFDMNKSKNDFRFNWIVITWIEWHKTNQNNCTLMMAITCCIDSVQTNKSTQNEISKHKIWKCQNIFQFKCHRTIRTWSYNSHLSMSICDFIQNLSIFWAHFLIEKSSNLKWMCS